MKCSDTTCTLTRSQFSNYCEKHFYAFRGEMCSVFNCENKTHYEYGGKEQYLFCRGHLKTKQSLDNVWYKTNGISLKLFLAVQANLKQYMFLVYDNDNYTRNFDHAV